MKKKFKHLLYVMVLAALLILLAVLLLMKGETPGKPAAGLSPSPSDVTALPDSEPERPEPAEAGPAATPTPFAATPTPSADGPLNGGAAESPQPARSEESGAEAVTPADESAAESGVESQSYPLGENDTPIG